MTTPSNGNKSVRLTLDGKSVVVELIEDGKTKDRDKLNPDLRSRRVSAAKALGVDDGTLLGWIDSVKAAGGTASQTFDIQRPETTAGTLIVRGMNDRDDQGEQHDLDPIAVLKSLLPTVSNDLVMKWANANALCCLDVDYHESGRKPPHESWLRARVSADLVPRPFAWHFSKGGGLHLFYVASEPFTAEELAAVAALSFRRIDPTASVELKTALRGPATGAKQDHDKQVFYTPGDVQDTTALLAGWSERTPADDAARDEWLASEGMVIGQRYDHTKCPINPTPGYTSTGDPVKVMEQGVFCHRCEGEGRSLRTKRLGYAPYSAIIGGESAGELGDMLRSLCHWGHARYILTRKYQFLEPFAEKAYRAALKAFHHGKRSAALVPLAFSDSTTTFTRLGDMWYNMDVGKPYITTRLNTIIADLPAVCKIADDGTPKPNEALVTLLMQPHDISKRGYPTIDTTFGYRLKKQHLSDPNDPATVEVYDPQLREQGGRYLPQYIPASRRNVEEAWGVIEEVAPGIDRKLVTLIMAGIGTAQETQLGMHPRLFVTGTSAAGKSTTPRLAAAILGTAVADFVHRADEYRWAQSLWKANREGGLVMLNELIKDTERAARGQKITLSQPFDPLLNVTPTAQVNVMHIGPMPYGRLSMFVMTEPKLPVGLRDEKQVARRMWYWNLVGGKKWSDTFPKHGLSDPGRLRLVSPKVATACDMIVSDVVDRFFVTPMTWEAIADAHGCQNLAVSDEFEDLTPLLRDLFRLVCEAPEITNKRLAGRYPNGYKKITRSSEGGGEEDDLTATYSQFADGRGMEWLQSRRLTEKDWRDILKTEKPVQLDLTNDGSNVFIRFRVGPMHAPIEVNEKIVAPTPLEVKP